VECEWDPKKNQSNIQNHSGIDFADALFVFEDEHEITVRDEAEGTEERFITLGWITKPACWSSSSPIEATSSRIMSARLAEPRERKLYEERL